MKKALLVFLYVSLFFVLFFSAKTIVVSKDGTLTTLQQAIDLADNGDTIEIEEGVYEENVVLNKSINIIGKTGKVTFTHADENIPVLFIIGAENLYVENIRFTGKENLIKSIMSNVAINDCGFSTYTTAINFTEGSLLLNNNSFQGHKIKEDLYYYYKGIAFIVNGCSSVSSSNNNLKNMSAGFMIYDTSKVESSRNVFEDVVTGEDYLNISDLSIIDNDYYQNHVAITLSGSTNAQISNNEFFRTTKWDICLSSEECKLCSGCPVKDFSGKVSGVDNISTSFSCCGDSEILEKLFE